jgi:hypothetical protein
MPEPPSSPAIHSHIEPLPPAVRTQRALLPTPASPPISGVQPKFEEDAIAEASAAAQRCSRPISEQLGGNQHSPRLERERSGDVGCLRKLSKSPTPSVRLVEPQRSTIADRGHESRRASVRPQAL